MTTDSHTGRRLRVTLASKVKMLRITWWEDHWIPLGALTLLAGREGLGKSTIACHWAARESRADRTVLYIHSEDSREHTVVPRLLAAGADLDKVIFIDVETEFTENGNLVLPVDNDALHDLIVEHQITFIVLDAATSAMSAQLSGKDDRDVRRFLEPLSRLAADHNIVIVGLVHFGKRDGADSGKLILGSIAWSQVARSVLSVALDPDSGNLVVTNTKGNLAPRTRSVEARIRSTAVTIDGEPAELGVLEWLGETTADARDYLAGEEGQGNRDVDDWLTQYLDDGPQKANDVFQSADANGFSKDQVKRAKKRVGAIAERPQNPGPWFWRMPSIVDSEVIHERTEQGAESRGQGVDMLPALSVLPVRSEGVQQSAEGGREQSAPCDSLLTPCTSPEPPAVNTPGRAAGQWLGSGKPVTPVAPTKLTCAQWLRGHVLTLMADQVDTIESRDLFTAGEAAGYGIDNLRRSVMNCDLIATVGRTGHGATYRLGAGSTSTVISCPEWLDGWLREHSDWVKAAEVFAAGDAAGYERMTVKSAAKRIGVLKRGASIATEWKFNPDHEQESA